MDTTTPYAARAHRCRVIAATAHTRAAQRVNLANKLFALSDLMERAAESFETEPLMVMDGITVTNVLPFDAAMALMEARSLLEDTPGTGFPADLTAYVIEPFSRRAMPTPAVLTPASPTLTRQAQDVLARLTTVHDDMYGLHAPELIEAYLRAALSLHAQYERLAVASADNARPRNQR